MTEARVVRCGRDRRKGDRRRKQIPFEGPDRRKYDRRSGRDRRLDARLAKILED